MRRCKAKVKTTQIEGRFHGWERIGEGDQNRLCALVETKDGQIHACHFSIQFLDPEK